MTLQQIYLNHNKDIKTWIKALRSGKYSQTTNTLQSSTGHCCLGVACDIFIPNSKKQYDGNYLIGLTPEEQLWAPQWLKDINTEVKPYLTGLSDSQDRVQETLIEHLNDRENMSFDEIADVLQLIFVEDCFGLKI